MNPPGLHADHLIFNYWNEKLISYYMFLFYLFGDFAISCEHLGIGIKIYGKWWIFYCSNLVTYRSFFLLFDLGFTLVTMRGDIPEIKPFQICISHWVNIFLTTIKILVRLDVLLFESFQTKNVLILFLNVLSNSLILNEGA